MRRPHVALSLMLGTLAAALQAAGVTDGRSGIAAETDTPIQHAAPRRAYQGDHAPAAIVATDPYADECAPDQYACEDGEYDYDCPYGCPYVGDPIDDADYGVYGPEDTYHQWIRQQVECLETDAENVTDTPSDDLPQGEIDESIAVDDPPIDITDTCDVDTDDDLADEPADYRYEDEYRYEDDQYGYEYDEYDYDGYRYDDYGYDEYGYDYEPQPAVDDQPVVDREPAVVEESADTCDEYGCPYGDYDHECEDTYWDEYSYEYGPYPSADEQPAVEREPAVVEESADACDDDGCPYGDYDHECEDTYWDEYIYSADAYRADMPPVIEPEDELVELDAIEGADLAPLPPGEFDAADADLYFDYDFGDRADTGIATDTPPLPPAIDEVVDVDTITGYEVYEPYPAVANQVVDPMSELVSDPRHSAGQDEVLELNRENDGLGDDEAEIHPATPTLDGYDPYDSYDPYEGYDECDEYWWDCEAYECECERRAAELQEVGTPKIRCRWLVEITFTAAARAADLIGDAAREMDSADATASEETPETAGRVPYLGL